MSIKITRSLILQLMDHISGKSNKPTPPPPSYEDKIQPTMGDPYRWLVYPGATNALELLDEMGGSMEEPSVLRITGYGMTSEAICARHGTATWVGHPIMRFVDSEHVQRLCSGLCEAYKSDRAVALNDIRCIEPYDQTFHVIVTPTTDEGFLCVLSPVFTSCTTIVTSFNMVGDHLQLLFKAGIRQGVIVVASWLSPFKILQWFLRCSIALLFAYINDHNSSHQRSYSP
ncbi:hypothetical protein O0I10_007321 [Lichtheimia ornata]|uniref:Uncharacterized protein n=1 Tax=Lichtheimia ornata TaxID=688661 RepID=A0AAD7V2M1_9FUNG|nr:uncharacterized protein O0I10_007321 [Lichtheimia ornata]KAJ8656987.1 hypothetical protein O0I10_007321 [Lichtheimia ornata]